MTRGRTATLVLLVCTVLAVPAVRADVKSTEKSTFKLEGAIGKIINFFSRSAREGVTSTVAVKGNRKLTTNDQTGEIVDLGEKKVYTLDMKKKTYTVETFDDIRKRMEDARKRAEAQAQKQSNEKQPQASKDANQPQVEIDVDIKKTGQKQTINGFETEEVVMTIATHEKGKKIEDAGGLLMTADMWNTATIPALKEIGEFDARYARELASAIFAGGSPEDAAAAAAMYPALKDINIRMHSEQGKMSGQPVRTTMTVDSVMSAEQVAEQQQQQQQAQKDSKDSDQPSSIGGALGGLAGRLARRKTEDNKQQTPASPEQKNRARIMTTTNEVLSVASAVSDTDVAIPMGFKEKK